MSDSDVHDEVPTDLWIRQMTRKPSEARRSSPHPSPLAAARRHEATPNIRRRSDPLPKGEKGASTDRGSASAAPVSGRSCMVSLVDDLAALAAELCVEGKLDRIGRGSRGTEPIVDEELPDG